MLIKHKHTKSISIVKKQFITIFILTGMIPVLILGIFTTIYVHRQMDLHYRSLAKADGIRINSVLFDITTTVYSQSKSIVNTTDSMRLFNSSKRTADVDLKVNNLNSTLTTLKDNNASISYIHIFSNNPNIKDCKNISYMPDFDDIEWKEKIGDSWSVWTSLTKYTIINTPYKELSLIRKFGIPSQDYEAYLIISIDTNYKCKKCIINYFKHYVCRFTLLHCYLLLNNSCSTGTLRYEVYNRKKCYTYKTLKYSYCCGK